MSFVYTKSVYKMNKTYLIKAIRKVYTNHGQTPKKTKWWNDNYKVPELREHLKKIRIIKPMKPRAERVPHKFQPGCVVEKPRIPQTTGSVAEDQQSETISKEVSAAVTFEKRPKKKIKGEAKKLKFSKAGERPRD